MPVDQFILDYMGLWWVCQATNKAGDSVQPLDQAEGFFGSLPKLHADSLKQRAAWRYPCAMTPGCWRSAASR
jgi:hypothetical protein